MSFELQKNVVGKFMAIDRKVDVANFHALAVEGLHNFEYTGISYAGNDLAHVTLNFAGDIESVNLPYLQDAINHILENFSDSSLVELKLEVMNKINYQRDVWMSSYFAYDGHRWDCDEKGLTNIMGTNTSALLLQKMGMDLPPGSIFRDKANNNVPVTATYMALLGLALFKFRTDCYIASWIHKYMIAVTCDTEAEVLAYDYMAGWPNREV